jgi:hypothetical protein
MNYKLRKQVILTKSEEKKWLIFEECIKCARWSTVNTDIRGSPDEAAFVSTRFFPNLIFPMSFNFQKKTHYRYLILPPGVHTIKFLQIKNVTQDSADPDFPANTNLNHVRHRLVVKSEKKITVGPKRYPQFTPLPLNWINVSELEEDDASEDDSNEERDTRFFQKLRGVKESELTRVIKLDLVEVMELIKNDKSLASLEIHLRQDTLSIWIQALKKFYPPFLLFWKTCMALNIQTPTVTAENIFKGIELTQIILRRGYQDQDIHRLREVIERLEFTKRSEFLGRLYFYGIRLTDDKLQTTDRVENMVSMLLDCY